MDLYPVNFLTRGIMATKICKHCGKEFVASKHLVAYCSCVCREDHNKNKLSWEYAQKSNKTRLHSWCNKTIAKKHCPVCGKEYETNVHNKIFCSPYCKTKHYQQNRAVLKERVCKVCGKTFLAKAKNKIYCSEYCQTNRCTNTCTVCGKTFTSARNNTKACSVKCMKEYQSGLKKCEGYTSDMDSDLARERREHAERIAKRRDIDYAERARVRMQYLREWGLGYKCLK